MTVPHYGKRAAGLLTAASPGDTLHFQFASYNDSGDSEALSGFAVTDIEVFKNGIAATRATDSGYSLISDTGQIGDRVGLYRFSVQLFNTADDTGHYESGAWYQVAVDGVVIDGKTVRLWVGSFEIGEPRANVVQLGGDTGALNWLRQTFASGFSDTGINQRFAQIQSDVDTGLRTHIDDSDTGVKDTIADLDTGVRALLALRDTGAVANAVWNFATRSVTNIADTGIVNSLAIIRADTDTGIQSGVTVTGFSDTGINDRLAKILADTDTGIQSSVAVTAITDTGIYSQIAALATASTLSTVSSNVSSIKTQTDKLLFDTGGEVRADIRRVNNITVQGTGDTGTSDYWRPGT